MNLTKNVLNRQPCGQTNPGLPKTVTHPPKAKTPQSSSPLPLSAAYRNLSSPSPDGPRFLSRPWYTSGQSPPRPQNFHSQPPPRPAAFCGEKPLLAQGFLRGLPQGNRVIRVFCEPPTVPSDPCCRRNGNLVLSLPAPVPSRQVWTSPLGSNSAFTLLM